MEQTLDRHRLASAGQAARIRLAEAGVHVVACTWVDNVGVTRVKAVPLSRLPHAATWGIGMSTVHDVFGVDDAITASEHIGGPVGDIRLHPDLSALTVMAAQPGWAWAPVDRWTQGGVRYPPDQRGFAQRMVDGAEVAGLSLRMGFELEFYLADATGSAASSGPAYGLGSLLEIADFARDLLAALETSGVEVEQFHPEYATSQFELSLAPADPVTAADRVVLARASIRSVARQFGMRVSFAPVPVLGAVGSGMHLHVSVKDAKHGNIFAGGDGPHGLTEPGRRALAALLARLPAICGLTVPSPASHLRLVPRQWAGAYQCWGVENREASLRLVQGVVGNQLHAANVELKCVDGSANPYLAVGAVAAVTGDGTQADGELPPPTGVDPQSLPENQRPPRLPSSVAAGLAALSADGALVAQLGPELFGAFCAVQRADAAKAAQWSDEQLVEAVRWRY